MSAKAVYQNQVLAVYITGDDLVVLLKDRYLALPVVAGQGDIVSGQAFVQLNEHGARSVRLWLDAEREAIERVRTVQGRKGSMKRQRRSS